MIKISWTQLKQIVNANGTVVQWFSDDNSYTIFDSSFTFQAIIPITIPSSATQADFENNYKTPAFSSKFSYSCSGVIQTGTSATDIATLSGNANTTVRLSRIIISGRNALPTSSTVSLVLRSSPDSGGTTSTPVITPHDSNTPAASSVVNVYTSNPTLGSSVGVLRVANLEFANTGGSPVPLLVWEFGPNDSQKPVLRNTNQQLCISLNGMQISVVHISFEWTEEQNV
jgi:hypothetical protein